MGVLLSVAAIVLAQAAPVADGATLPTRIERAVATGDRDALQQCRRELERSDDVDRRYTLAYVDWREGLLAQDDAKARKQMLKRAQENLEAIVKDTPDDAEALALLGGVYGNQITGMLSGIKLGRKSSAQVDAAWELAPDNPRVAFQLGVSKFRTPKRFGGDIERAEELLRKAASLFDSEKAPLPWPNWGRADVQAFLGQVLIKRGDLAGARKAYEKGLTLAPESRWIRQVLLPQLEALEAGDGD